MLKIHLKQVGKISITKNTWLNLVLLSFLLMFSACFTTHSDKSGSGKKADSHVETSNFASKGDNTIKNDSEYKGYKLIAHRGGIVEDKYNEFDPRSIQAAIDKGYYMLEIDVRKSKDGVLVVHHDDDLKRFFNTPKRIEDLTWTEIKALQSDKGNYHPVSFEKVAQICSGKIKMMIDIKPKHPSPAFFEKLGNIMEKYNLLSGSYFIDKEARKYFWGKAKFEFRISEALKIRAKFDSGEDVASNYFLFDHGNRLNAEAVKWCQKNKITVVASVNIVHYRFENHLDGAFRDIKYWKECGVTEFQIDSDYDKWLSVNDSN